jgi:phosphoribosylamine---glycine ligase
MTTTRPAPSRILVIGAGGREHALAWKLASEPGVGSVIVAPGSAGIAETPNVSIRPDTLASDFPSIVALAAVEGVDLVVVGPEAPLAAGLADALGQAGIAVFGPSRAAAAIESSKAFCHDVAESAGVRMARSIVCHSRSEADAAAATLEAGQVGIVIKEDGLAAGKGVTVLDPGQDAAPTLADLYPSGMPDTQVVIEERLHGPEASVIAICDGMRAIALPAARDHKRLLDDDHGPNTGGMGAYAPLPELDETAVTAIVAAFHLPILAELARRGTPFRGFLYAGLMLTDDGPILLECNARLGDPEAQVILPLLDGPIGPMLFEAAVSRLSADRATVFPSLPGAAVGVVLAGEGYPVEVSRGAEIEGIDDAGRLGGLVFHAGTGRATDRWVTNGGRILTIVGRGSDLAEAGVAADRAAAAISFAGVQRRHDIGRAAIASAAR